MSRTRLVMLVPLLLVPAAIPASRAPAVADDNAPLVVLDLATEGAPFDFGLWLADRLDAEDLQVRWPDHDEAGEVEGNPACVVAWSESS